MAAPQMGYQMRSFGRWLRKLGQSLDKTGLEMMGKEGYRETLVPSTRVVTVKGKQFTYGLQNFVASSASVVGEVKMGELTSVWYGATLRGDAGSVVIGRNSSILDNALVSGSKGAPTTLGDDVIVCPGAVVASATVGDGAMIGMGAVVQRGAKIGNDAFIDAGAVVTSGTTVPAGQLWSGSPARMLRSLSPEEMTYVRSMAGEYGALGQRHFEQAAKSPAEVEEEAGWADFKVIKGMAPEEAIPQPDPDVEKYYKMTAPVPDHGVFREAEFNIPAETALREAEEVAADAAENEAYARAASLRRTGEALKQLSALRADLSAPRTRLIADLASLDPAAAGKLEAMMTSAAAASAAGDADAKARLVGEIAAIDPSAHYADDVERVAAAEAIFNALVGHAKAAPSIAAPAAAAGQAAAAKQAQA